MNSQLSALLRTDLRYFIRKVFGTVLPGTTYLPLEGPSPSALKLKHPRRVYARFAPL
jgi:hypothetical protein